MHDGVPPPALPTNVAAALQHSAKRAKVGDFIHTPHRALGTSASGQSNARPLPTAQTGWAGFRDSERLYSLGTGLGGTEVDLFASH